MRSIVGLAVALFVVGSASATPPKASHLQVLEAWARPAGAGLNGAGYMRIANRGPRAERLVAVESPVARRVEIHRSVLKDGVMSMQRLTDGVSISPGGSVAFAPGGAHVMFIGLMAPLKVTDQAPATLVFESGARLPMVFDVRAAAPQAGHSHP